MRADWGIEIFLILVVRFKNIHQKHNKVTERIYNSKYSMAEERYALLFWIEDEQHSVVECKDIIGEVEINKTLPVARRTKKKGSVVRN